MKPMLTILACMAVLLGLLLSPAAAITINVTAAPNNQTDHPSFDPNLVQLTGIMQAAADYWEGIILDNHTLDITFGYLDLGPAILGIAQVQADDGQRTTMGAIALDTIVNAAVPFERDWYFDPTPLNNSEFNMQQVLVRDLTAQQTSMYYNGSPPDLLEAGFWGNYSGADLGDDVFTVALHEIGHLLGVTNSLPGSAAQLADGDFDFNPGFVNGQSVAAEYWDLPGDIDPHHLRSPDALMSVGAGSGDRHLPGATDVFAAAAISGWTAVDLYRMDYLAGTVWDLGINWEGGTVPDNNDEVYVRHGGDVSVLLDSVAGNLIIRDGSSVNTNDNFLTVSNKVTVESGPGGGSDAALTVENGGRIIADEVEINDGGNVVISGSMFNSRILTDLVDINAGGVLLGHGLVSADALTNDGTITAINPIGDNVVALRILPTGGGDIDLDGTSGNGELFAVLGNIDIAGPLNDAFDGEMTVGATRSISFFEPWQLGQTGSVDPATINLNGGANAASAAVVDGDPITANRGQINVTGFGEIDADATLAADVEINVATGGNLAFSGTTNVEGAQFSVGSGAILHFEGPTTVDSADFSFTGNGQAQFNGPTTHSFNTTIASNGLIRQNADTVIVGTMVVDGGVFDLDGVSGNTTINLGNAGNNGALTLNVDAIDTGNNTFNGTIETLQSGLTGRLTINLTEPTDSWTMAGTLNLDGGNPLFLPVRVAGSRMVHTGQLNVTNSRVAITADTDFASTGSTNFAAMSSELHMRGITRVFAGADFNGLGTLFNDSGGDMTLLDAADTSFVGLQNAGTLRIGASPGEADVNRFTQTSTGLWEVEIGGLLPTQFDMLTVDAAANLAGTLNVSLIDSFVSSLGNTFVILAAGGGVNGTFDSEILPFFAGLTFDVIYNPQSVVLQVIEAPLIPGDFDGDGDVDGADFVAWQTHFPTAMGATLADGDADGDGDVDGADFVVWQTNFPFTPAPSSAPVPEPGAIWLAACCAAIGYVVSRRHKVIR